MPKTLKEYLYLVIVIGIIINYINSNNMNYIGKIDFLVMLCLLIQEHG